MTGLLVKKFIGYMYSFSTTKHLIHMCSYKPHISQMEFQVVRAILECGGIGIGNLVNKGSKSESKL